MLFRSAGQIPVAGDLPGVGGLFGQRGRELSKQELVILIKPTVVHSEPSSSVVLNGMPATAN